MTAKEAIRELVGFPPVAAAELVERYRMTRLPTTVSRHQRALHQEGLLARRWDGDTRFGRFVYFEAPTVEIEIAQSIVPPGPLSINPRRLSAALAHEEREGRECEETRRRAAEPSIRANPVIPRRAR